MLNFLRLSNSFAEDGFPASQVSLTAQICGRNSSQLRILVGHPLNKIEVVFVEEERHKIVSSEINLKHMVTS